MSDERKPWAEPAVRGYWAAEGDARHSLDHFFAEALRAARADALEEAARLVEGEVERFTPAFLAGSIRALKDRP